MEEIQKTTFNISKMDCPSEESLIRLKLEQFSNIKSMQFDISNRKQKVYHTDNYEPILSALDSLKLDTNFIDTVSADFLLCNRNSRPKTFMVGFIN